MVTQIPEGQLCQAFDPVLIIPGKIDNIAQRGSEVTSCYAPAFVYIEGSHGKRFLCDFHYFYEKDIITVRNLEHWKDVEQYCFDNLESIINTFGDPFNVSDDDLELIKNNKCWCGADSQVLGIHRKNSNIMVYFCNFHYRKIFYRYKNHGKDYLDTVIVKDARKLLYNMSIKEEGEKLPKV